MLEYPNIFVLYLHTGHDSVSTGVKIDERIGERSDYGLPNSQRHAKGRLSSTNSARMPPKNSGKFVINKKFNEGQGMIQLWSPQNVILRLYRQWEREHWKVQS